jgi:hypothetical protein
VVEGLVLADGLTALGGKKKLGKSLFCLQMAVAVATGGSLLGRRCKRGKVVYVCLEDGQRRIQDRLRRQAAAAGGLDIAFITRLRPLDAGGMADLRAILAQERPLVLIIDTIASAKTGKTDENDAGSMGDIFNGLRVLAQDLCAAILAVLHHGKLVTGDPGFDFRGSSAMGGAADINLGLYRADGVSTLKGEGRDVDALELRIALDIPTLTWDLVGDARALARNEADEEALAAVKALGEGDAGAVARELGKSRTRVQVALKRLAREGKLASRVEKSGRVSKIVYTLS